MPTYSIDGPDGKTYSIDGPDGATREQVIAKIKEKQAFAPQQESSALGDVATSFGRGIAKGAIGLVGLPGDISHMVGTGVEKAGEFLGVAPRPVPELGGISPPSSADITGKVESVAGKFEEPKTTAGKYAQSVGEFVPSAFIGPGGALTKAATTVAGGVGAEVGGELGGEPGRFVGGLLGGTGTGVIGAESQAKRLSAALPDSAANRTAAKAAYKAIENARLTVEPMAINTFITQAKAQLENQLIDASEAPAVFRAVDNLANGNGEIASIMGLYENLGKVKPSEGTKYTVASIIRDEVGDFLDKLTPADVTSGDPAFTAAMWNHAKASWFSHKKLEMIEQARDKAERQAGRSGTGANTENTLRQRMDEILNSEKKSRGLPQDVKDKIKEIVVGNNTRNAARYLGKYAPSGPVSAMGTMFTGLEAGVPYGVAFGAGTTIAKHLGTYLTERQIREVEDMIKKASPIGRPVAAQQAGQQPNFKTIVPAAVLRSQMAAGGDSPLAQPGQ